jgi:hypothetical protein
MWFIALSRHTSKKFKPQGSFRVGGFVRSPEKDTDVSRVEHGEIASLGLWALLLPSGMLWELLGGRGRRKSHASALE